MAPILGLAGVLRISTLEALRSSDPYDAIVVGGGAAGGLAAMLLAEGGLRVLVLDAGLPSALMRAPLRKLAGRLVRRLSSAKYIGHLPPAAVPKARKRSESLDDGVSRFNRFAMLGSGHQMRS